MRRYNNQVIATDWNASDAFYDSDELSSIQRKSSFDGVVSCPSSKLEQWALPETTSHHTESSYEIRCTLSAESSDIEEASLAFSDVKAFSGGMDNKVGALDKKLSMSQPTIAFSSDHTAVSDITDGDFFTFINHGTNLQNEIEALKYVIFQEQVLFV